MESLELDVLALVAKEVHHHLEIDIVRDVTRHDAEVGTVKEYLAKQLERLPLRHVVGRLDEHRE